MNQLSCQDCHTLTNRGRMHVRSRCFEQVAWCESCWEIRQRLDRIVKAVREGVESVLVDA